MGFLEKTWEEASVKGVFRGADDTKFEGQLKITGSLRCLTPVQLVTTPR